MPNSSQKLQHLSDVSSCQPLPQLSGPGSSLRWRISTTLQVQQNKTQLSSMRSFGSTICGWYVLQPNLRRAKEPGLKTRQSS